MTIQEKIKFYKNNLDSFEETLDKYKFLLDQAKKSKPFPEEFRKDNFKVQGCQAQVWLVPKFKDNLLNFYSDSDAFISKGMITILIDIYGNKTPHDILDSDFQLVKTLKLDTLLTQGRTNGVYAMLKKLKEYAQVFLK
tara:strand:- start:106 stop:519 length:414 start_codon:yes stop_codon:yes gene_type:complete